MGKGEKERDWGETKRREKDWEVAGTTPTVVGSNGSLEAKRSLRMGKKKKEQRKIGHLRAAFRPSFTATQKFPSFPVNYSPVTM